MLLQILSETKVINEKFHIFTKKKSLNDKYINFLTCIQELKPSYKLNGDDICGIICDNNLFNCSDMIKFIKLNITEIHKRTNKVIKNLEYWVKEQPEDYAFLDRYIKLIKSEKLVVLVDEQCITFINPINADIYYYYLWEGIEPDEFKPKSYDQYIIDNIDNYYDLFKSANRFNELKNFKEMV